MHARYAQQVIEGYNGKLTPYQLRHTIATRPYRKETPIFESGCRDEALSEFGILSSFWFVSSLQQLNLSIKSQTSLCYKLIFPPLSFTKFFCSFTFNFRRKKGVRCPLFLRLLFLPFFSIRTICYHLTMRFDFVELTYYLSYVKNYNLIISKMPTVKGIVGPYRFSFYSFDCEEPMHVHVQ